MGQAVHRYGVEQVFADIYFGVDVYAQHLFYGRLHHIALDEQHALVVVGEHQRKIDRNGRLALVIENASDHQNLVTALFHEVFDPRAEQAEGLRIAEARRRIVYQNIPFNLAPEKRTQSELRFFVSERGQSVAVYPVPDVLVVFDLVVHR